MNRNPLLPRTPSPDSIPGSSERPALILGIDSPYTRHVPRLRQYRSMKNEESLLESRRIRPRSSIARLLFREVERRPFERARVHARTARLDDFVRGHLLHHAAGRLAHQHALLQLVGLQFVDGQFDGRIFAIIQQRRDQTQPDRQFIGHALARGRTCRITRFTRRGEMVRLIARPR